MRRRHTASKKSRLERNLYSSSGDREIREEKGGTASLDAQSKEEKRRKEGREQTFFRHGWEEVVQ